MNHWNILYGVEVFLLIGLVKCIKVDVQGSLSLGRDVIDTVNHFLLKEADKLRSGTDGRRFLSDDENYEKNEDIIRGSKLCADIYYCNENLKRYLENYIIELAKQMEDILLNLKELPNKKLSYIQRQYQGKLKECIITIKHILKESEVVDQDTVGLLKMLIKKINGTFQMTFLTFLESLNINNTTINQQVVIELGRIETKQEYKMCQQLILCRTSQKCSNALKQVLQLLVAMPEENMREFMKCFLEELSYTWFHTVLSDATSNQFKNILNEMAFSAYAPTKKVLVSFLKSLDLIQSSDISNLTTSDDVSLVQVTFSDLDHIYDQSNEEDFKEFLDAFNNWKSKSIKLNKAMRTIMKKIMKQISTLSDVLFQKLKNEVRVFLELTVDPEK